MEENPYKAPQSDVIDDDRLPDDVYRHLAIGQRLIIYAIALYLSSFVIVNYLGNIGTWTGLLSLVLALIGTVRALMGVDWNIFVKVLYVIMMFIPLLNLLALASLSSKITTMLRDAGYQVGFFGVKR